MIGKIYKKTNQLRRQAYFNLPLFKAKKTYAFVGFGMHAISSLLPILNHFGIRLKYICTKESIVEPEIADRYAGTAFIRDLEMILQDPEVSGVFVSADPVIHGQLLHRLLQAGKKVFIEKPPCLNGAELEKIIAANTEHQVVTGLQRRYWPGNLYVKKKVATAASYTYHFHFGPYLSGNPVYELFIHAVDYAIFLFGECVILSSAVQKGNKNISLQLHLRHQNGVSGWMDLSTDYSWTDPIEQLQIQIAGEWLDVEYPLLVKGRLKPRRFFNLPAERILHQPLVSKTYFSAGNLIVPALDMNTLVLQGFFNELQAFIEMVEKNDRNVLPGELLRLRAVYKILDEMDQMTH